MTADNLIRVAIIDDSPFICRLLSSYLAPSDGFEVVGTALNGARALDLVEKLKPDVVTLDIQMPVMDGLESLEHIMRDFPAPVVMISGVGKKAAQITLAALEAGAVDFVLKCPPESNVDADALKNEIISKVRSASTVKVIRSLPASVSSAQLAILPSKKAASKIARRARRETARQKPTKNLLEYGVVVIGASTGGPVALRELLSSLPVDFPSAIVIVQHIPENFTEVLAVQLNNHVSIEVREAKQGDKLCPGLALVAPGDYHLLISHDSKVVLNRGQTINGHRPAVDVTMQSAADVYGSLAMGVVLTGMGQDGANGLMAIQSKGGITFAQDAKSSVVDGMPKSARDRGVAQGVGSPSDIAHQLASGEGRETSMIK